MRADSLGDIKLVNIWASWCITFFVEHLFLTKLSGQNFKIIGLNYKDSNAKAVAWLEKHGSPFLFSIYDPRGDLPSALGVTGAPETFLIIARQIVAHLPGEMTPQKRDAIIAPRIFSASHPSSILLSFLIFIF